MGYRKRPTIAIVMGDNRSEYLDELAKDFHYCAMEEDVNVVFVKEAKMPKYCEAILSESFQQQHSFHFHKIHDYIRFINPDVIILAYGSMTSFRYVKRQQEYFRMYQGIPVLLIEDVSVDPSVPYLISDNYGGMRQMMEHLVKYHGYRQICFLAGPEINFDSKERLQAYYDVMKESGIQVSEHMVAYGDYTEQVEPQIEQLLDENPGIEALVCANDTMAKAAYRVCEQRGLMVGSDIAITGYDDSEICRKLNPALTTVSHSAMQYAYHALHAAIRLYYGQEVKLRRIETVLCKRGSCGCDLRYSFPEIERLDTKTLRVHMKSRIQQITDNIFIGMPYHNLQVEYNSLLEELFDYIFSNVFDSSNRELSKEVISRYLRKIYAYPFVDEQLVGAYIHRLLKDLMNMTKTEEEKDKLIFALTASRNFQHSKEIIDMHTLDNIHMKQAWFLASFTRDMLTAGWSFEENMRCILKRMRAMGIPSTYIMFFQEEVRFTDRKEIDYPQEIYLAGYYTKEEFQICSYGGGTPMSRSEGFKGLIPRERGHVYMSYLLFAGDRHYGLMLCENEEWDYEYLLECSLQLGSMFQYMTLQDTQLQAHRELQMTLKRIEEQNRVLNFVSQQDALTKLLNRRGFMEATIQAFALHQNCMAAAFFADLDHLKEINDSFGHMAGDFAIQTGASFLVDCLPPEAIIARIGGDEYVALVFEEEDSDIQTGYSKDMISRIREHIREYNAKSDKEYMIELSIGAYEFLCNQEANIESIIGLSDSIMYEEKKKRRPSVKKNP